MSCSYAPDENKLRLYSTERLDEDTYARAKALGFRWAPKQACFFAPAWSPAREDFLLELCGEIGDEDTTLVDRAEVRAERFEDYSDKREAEAEQAHAAIQHIMDGIPTGQPILVGHSSERRARKDAQRIQDGMRKAVNLWDTAQYWERRAKAALQHAKYKERPDVRARRIKTLEAEQRKVQRTQDESRAQLALWTKDGLTHERAVFITNYSTGYMSFCFPLADYPREPPASQYEGSMSLYSALTGGVITCAQARDLAVPMYEHSLEMCRRWLDHLSNRLAYERAMLDDAGGTEADRTKPEAGGACRCWASHRGGWSTIQKVNKVTVSVLDNWGNGGKNFTRTIPFDKLSDLMSKADVERWRSEGRIIDHPDGTGFYRQDAPMPTPREPETPKPEAYEAMKEQLKAGVQVVTVDELFPTPAVLADRMVRLADVQPGERVLEPSAGTGALLDAIGRVPCFYTDEASHVWAIEEHYALSLALAKRRDPRTNYTCGDFLRIDPAHGEPFDVVLTNPPFSDQYRHCTHALSFLRPGGRLVAVMSSGALFHTTKEATAFRVLLTQYNAQWDDLPPDTFKESGTSVRTVLVSVTLPPAPAQACPGTPSREPVPAPEPVALQTAQEPVPEPGPLAMQLLAREIEVQAQVTQAKLEKERLLLDWQSKKRPTKPQAAPCGLFAQTQGALL